MTVDQFNEFKREMTEKIEATIQSKVNGKIDKIDKKLDAYILVDEAWKKTATPYVKFGTNVKGFAVIAGYFGAFIVSVTACWSFIEWCANKITNK